MGFVKHHILTCEAYFFTGQLVMLKSVPFVPETFSERFAIGRVICTPTFAERSLAAMEQIVAALERRRIAMQIVHEASEK
jgi:hypothetical protein